MQSLSIYRNELSRIPPLSPAQERTAGPNALAAANLRYAYTVASAYEGRGIPLEELLSAANMGLLKAAWKFDASRGVKFISFAVWAVRTEICALFQYADRAGYSDLSGILSLDDPIPGNPESETRTLSDTIPDPGEGPQEALQDTEAVHLTREALEQLSPRERALLVACYGLDGKPPRTLERVGAALGLSKERVRQIRDKALFRIATGSTSATSAHTSRRPSPRKAPASAA